MPIKNGQRLCHYCGKPTGLAVRLRGQMKDLPKDLRFSVPCCPEHEARARDDLERAAKKRGWAA